MDLEEDVAAALLDDAIDSARAIVGDGVDVSMGGTHCAHQWVTQIENERPVECPEELHHLL